MFGRLLVLILLVLILLASCTSRSDFTVGTAGCAPEDERTFCARTSTECGPVTMNDNCGVVRQVDCGSCAGGTWCDSGACRSCNVYDHCGAGCEDCSSQALSCRPDGAACAPADGDCTGLPDFTLCTLDTTSTEGVDRWYDICVDEVCVSPGCGDETCNAPGPHFTLADTSQTLCYDNSTTIACPGEAGSEACGSTPFCGQDAQYGWDYEYDAAERFTRTDVLGDAVVEDNVTGLMWQGCSSGQTGSACTGTATTSNWSAALADCNDLSWAGYDDWRVPDESELFSIVDLGTSGPAIDTAAFPATASWFWTSSAFAGAVADTWTMDFGSGLIEACGASSPDRLRCVRRERPTVQAQMARFVRDEPGQPMVSDGKTGLRWQGCVAGTDGGACSSGAPGTFTWQEALAYCESLTWADLADWHLPNLKELRSIVDNRRLDPAIDPTPFPATPSTGVWTSSSASGNPSNAWSITFSDGWALAAGKTTTASVRCVH